MAFSRPRSTACPVPKVSQVAIRKSVASAANTTPYASAGELNSWRATSLAIAPSKPPSPNAIACAAPHRPMRTPWRAARPRPTSAIIDPIAATANAPLATPSANTSGRNGHPGRQSSNEEEQASAEATIRPLSRCEVSQNGHRTGRWLLVRLTAFQAARRRFVRLLAALIHPGSVRTQSGEWLQDQILCAVGEHRNKDEDREAPPCGSARLAAAPRGRTSVRGSVPIHGAVEPLPSMFCPQTGSRRMQCWYGCFDRNERAVKRIEIVAGMRPSTRSGNHHHPDDRRRAARRGASTRRQQHEQ